ncbi:MAG TPA: peroxiredoxin [Fimbriimonadaceae bacterium]|nr:peroxiredoxin [Fimbriimonadaceae bacterium]
MLEPGEPFPNFTLPDQDDNPVSLSDFKGSPTVIYFYPKDDTGGCTAEACGFQESMGDIPGARVVGVSPDPPASHRKFRAKYGLTFTLLADTQKELIGPIGLWVEKKLYGNVYMGVARTTVLLDKEGIIRQVWRNVNPKGHAEEVVAALQ